MRSDEWPAWFSFAFGFLGAGGRFPKARRGRVFIVKYNYYYLLTYMGLVSPSDQTRGSCRGMAVGCYAVIKI